MIKRVKNKDRPTLRLRFLGVSIKIPRTKIAKISEENAAFLASNGAKSGPSWQSILTAIRLKNNHYVDPMSAARIFQRLTIKYAQ